MKKIILLTAVAAALSIPVLAQKNVVTPQEEVLVKCGKNTIVRTESGIYMNAYDKGNKECLTYYLGRDNQEASCALNCIHKWYKESDVRGYKEGCGNTHHHRHGHHNVTLYHGTKHCHISTGNGEYCRRHVSRKEKCKEHILACVPEKFLKKACSELAK